MRSLWKKLLFPPLPLLTLLTAGCGWGLVYLFLHNLETRPIAYALYPLAFYTVVALSVRLAQGILHIRAVWKKNPHYSDLDYQARRSLYLSFAVDVLYGLSHGTAALLFFSPWLGALAFYYIVLGIEHFILLRSSHDPDKTTGWKKYRFCGFSLLVLTVAIMAINFHSISQGEASHYPGFMIYAVAGYIFYSFGSSLYNIARYNKLKNPVYTASKLLKLATSFVSVFSLQRAMFEAFGDGTELQTQMNILTGTAVCLLVAGMSVYMIRQSGKHL